jgi:hypothetical protein
MGEPKGIRMMARPWQPQDLLDDLQLLIDEEPDRYLNDRRTTLCMARDFLREHFAEPGWISVHEKLPENNDKVLAFTLSGKYAVARYDQRRQCWIAAGNLTVTHWMPLPDVPEVEV